MLQLTLNGKVAVLKQDTQVSIVTNNPILVTDKEDASYPFTLPLEANRHIFGYIERTTSNDIEDPFTAILRFGSFGLLAGLAYISDVNYPDVEIYIRTDTKQFYGAHGSKILADIDMGSYQNTSPITSIVWDSYIRGNDESAFVFPPIYDQHADNGYDPGQPQYNRFDPLTGYPALDIASSQSVGANKICPCIFLHNAIRILFESLGYTCETDNLSDIDGFDDVIIVNTLNSSNVYSRSYSGSLSYAKMFPRTTVSTFLSDLAKFGIYFFVDESKKVVHLSAITTLRTTTTSVLKVIDGSGKKSVEMSEIPSNRRFFDKQVDLSSSDNDYDASLASLLSYMEVNTGASDADDTEEVESVSSPVASVSELTVVCVDNWVESGKLRYWILDSEQDNHIHILTAHNKLVINSTKLSGDEIRFAIWQKVEQRTYAMSELTYASYNGWPDYSAYLELMGDTDFRPKYVYRFPSGTYMTGALSLLWADKNSVSGLYSRFAQTAAEKDQLTQSHTFNLDPRTSVALMSKILSTNVVIQLQRYLVKKQTITFVMKGLQTWEVIVHPI